MLLITVDWDDPLFDSKLHSILKFELPLANKKIKSKNSECFITLSYEWDDILDKLSIVAIFFNASCSYCGIETQHRIEREDLIAKKDFTKKSCFNFYCKHCPQVSHYETLFLSNNKFTMLRTKRSRTNKFSERLLKASSEIEGGSSKNDRVEKLPILGQPKISEVSAPIITDNIEEIEVFSVSIEDISHENVLRYARKVKEDWFSLVQLKSKMKSSRLYLIQKNEFSGEKLIVQGLLEESLRYLTDKKYIKCRVSNNEEVFKITRHGLKNNMDLDIVDLAEDFHEGKNIHDSEVLRVKTIIWSNFFLQDLKAILRGKRSKSITFDQIKSELKVANEFKTDAIARRTLILGFLRKRNNSRKIMLKDLEKEIKKIHDEQLTSMLSRKIDKLIEEKYIKPIGNAYQLTGRRYHWLTIYVNKLRRERDLPFFFKIFGCFSFLFFLVIFLLIIST